MNAYFISYDHTDPETGAHLGTETGWACGICGQDFTDRASAEAHCRNLIEKDAPVGRADVKPLTQKQKAARSIVTPQQLGVRRAMRHKKRI